MKARLLFAVSFLTATAGFSTFASAQWGIPNEKIKAIFDAHGNPVKLGNLMRILDSSDAKLLWQRMVFPTEPVPQVTLEDVHYDPTSHLDTTAIFHTPDIASTNSSAARWYGVTEQHDYDPHILLHGYNTAKDSGILFSGAHDLMLWFHPHETPVVADSGRTLYFNSFPSYKIDTGAFSKHGMIEIDSNVLGNLPQFYEQPKQCYSMPNAGGSIDIDRGMVRNYDGPKPKQVSDNIWLIDSAPKKK